MGRKADVSGSAVNEGNPPPRRSVFSSILAKFRRAESKTKGQSGGEPLPNAGHRQSQKHKPAALPASAEQMQAETDDLGFAEAQMSVKARAALFDSPPPGRGSGRKSGRSQSTPPQVAGADDKEGKRRTSEPAASPSFSVVADARAASGGGGARPPRSPSRGLSHTPDGGGDRHRRTPSAAERSTREVCRELQSLMALADAELDPRRLSERSPYGSPMRASHRSNSRAGSASGRSAAGSVAGSLAGSRAGSAAGSRAGSVAGSRAGSVAGTRAGSVASTPEKELLPPQPMLGASPGMIAAQMEAWKRAQAARAAAAREQPSSLQGSASETPRSVRRGSGHSVRFADDSESDGFGTPVRGRDSPLARPALAAASGRDVATRYAQMSRSP